MSVVVALVRLNARTHAFLERRAREDTSPAVETGSRADLTPAG
jgi:hypothetical protein